MIEITTVPTNKDLYSICEQQWKAIEALKEENNEISKENYMLSKELDELKRNLSYQFNILL